MNAQQNHRLASLALLAGLTLAGCDGADPMGPADDAVSALAAVVPGHGDPGQQLPFRLDADATLLAQELAPDFGPPLFGRSYFDGRCSVPSDFVIRFSIVGQATHLGELRGAAEHCSQVDFTTGVSAITDGQAHLASANGDVLYIHYVRQVPQGGAAESWTFVGGTGRFASASGEATSHPTCNRATGTCVLSVEGVIAYGGFESAGDSE